MLVKADDKSRAYGQTNPVFTATISGLVNGETSNVKRGRGIGRGDGQVRFVPDVWDAVGQVHIVREQRLAARGVRA